MEEQEMITSRKNAMVSQYRLLQKSAAARYEQSAFVIEGARLCRDAAKSGIIFRHLLYTQRAKTQYRQYLNAIMPAVRAACAVSESIAAYLSDVKTPQGIFALCEIPGQAAVFSRQAARYLALERMQDPGNLGTILRTAEALGVAGLLLSEDSCDLWSPKVLRAAMGAPFRLPVSIVPNLAGALQAAQREGYRTYAAVADRQAASVVEAAFAPKAVLAIGNEGAGLSEAVIASCMEKITIPMAGEAESFNAAAAATILIWEMMRGE